MIAALDQPGPGDQREVAGVARLEVVNLDRSLRLKVVAFLLTFFAGFVFFFLFLVAFVFAFRAAVLEPMDVVVVGQRQIQFARGQGTHHRRVLRVRLGLELLHRFEPVARGRTPFADAKRGDKVLKAGVSRRPADPALDLSKLGQVQYRIGQLVRADLVGVVRQHAEPRGDRHPSPARWGESVGQVEDLLRQRLQQVCVAGRAERAGRVGPEHVGRGVLAFLAERLQQLRPGAVLHLDRRIGLLFKPLDQRLDQALGPPRVQHQRIFGRGGRPRQQAQRTRDQRHTADPAFKHTQTPFCKSSCL